MSLTLGDCFALPAGDGRTIFAQLVFISKEFKNVVAMRVWPGTVDPTAREPPAQPNGDSYLLFFEKNLPRRGKWALLGKLPLGSGFEGGLRFYSGGEVFLGDEHVGPAAESDRGSLPELLVAGDVAVARCVASLRVGSPQRLVFRVPDDW